MRTALLWIVTVFGALAVLISLHFALQDWSSLNEAYVRFEQIVNSAADIRSVTIAEAEQNALRINVFADGTWALLGGILAAIGVHGLCLMPTRTAPRES